MLRGIPCAGGSDAPVEDCAPLQGIYDAMRRLPHALKQQHTQKKQQEEEGDESRHPHPHEAVFLPDERLSFAEALWLYTGGAAHACFAESRLGSIAPGHAADFVVVDRDVTVAERAEALLEARVEQVWVAGRCRLDSHRGGQATGSGSDSGSTPTKLEGPFIPGKNGPLLPGKRLGLSCCGH